MRSSSCLGFVVLFLRGGLVASHTVGLCIPWQADIVEHQLDFSPLPSTAQVFVCGNHTRSRFVYIRGFYTNQELILLRNNFREEARQGNSNDGFKAPQWVEDRVSKFLITGSESHDAWLEQGDANDTVDGESLHIDRNHAQSRFATMLSYIQSPDSGGHTIFPYVGTLSEWGASRNEEDLNKLSTLLPSPWEVRKRSGVVIQLGGLHANSDQEDGLSKLAQIRPLTTKMCMAVKLAHEQGLPYPYFAAAPDEGSAIFFWHWLKTPTQTSQEWVDVVPDWHLEAWHGRCAARGKRIVLRSFRHMPGLNCKADLATTHNPPKRTDCVGFSVDGKYGCGKFACDNHGENIKVTYKKPTTWLDTMMKLIMPAWDYMFGHTEL